MKCYFIEDATQEHKDFVLDYIKKSFRPRGLSEIQDAVHDKFGFDLGLTWSIVWDMEEKGVLFLKKVYVRLAFGGGEDRWFVANERTKEQLESYGHFMLSSYVYR